jgi:predicted chitinase
MTTEAAERAEISAFVNSLSEGRDYTTRAGTVAAIESECIRQGIGLKTQIAYVLATVEWETADTFKPVREAYWKSEAWRKRNLRYFPWYGRGYCQLTWDYNYRRYQEILGIPLVANPDRAMEPAIACFILVHGFKHGVFTGKKITDYITKGKTDYIGARRCINGTDKAAKIAAIAVRRLRAMA